MKMSYLFKWIRCTTVGFATLGVGALNAEPAVGFQVTNALAQVITNTGTTSPTVLTDSVFGPNSFWYTPIPADAPLHPQSRDFVADFIRQKKTFYGTVSINLTAYASPVYVVPQDQPTVKVAQWACFPQFGLDRSIAQQWSAVPIPTYAIPAAGSDAEMTVYQPSTDTIWEFWRMRRNGGQWEACWGGQFKKASQSDGRWPGIYGTTATGLPFLGGQITAEELRRGEIRHVMGIALVETEAAAHFSWPAKRSDGYNPKKVPNRIPEGLRFRLDPKVNVDKLQMHPVGKTIARAAQKYGFVVWDKGGAITLRAQNPRSYTAAGLSDPYPALFGKAQSYDILTGFPWDKLQFLPQDYGLNTLR